VTAPSRPRPSTTAATTGSTAVPAPAPVPVLRTTVTGERSMGEPVSPRNEDLR
jgi:hypothetical protein